MSIDRIHIGIYYLLLAHCGNMGFQIGLAACRWTWENRVVQVAAPSRREGDIYAAQWQTDRLAGRQAGTSRYPRPTTTTTTTLEIYVRAPEEVPVHRCLAHGFTHNIVTSEKSHFTQKPRLLPPAQDCRLTCAQ